MAEEEGTEAGMVIRHKVTRNNHHREDTDSNQVRIRSPSSNRSSIHQAVVLAETTDPCLMDGSNNGMTTSEYECEELR